MRFFSRITPCLKLVLIACFYACLPWDFFPCIILRFPLFRHVPSSCLRDLGRDKSGWDLWGWYLQHVIQLIGPLALCFGTIWWGICCIRADMWETWTNKERDREKDEEIRSNISRSDRGLSVTLDLSAYILCTINNGASREMRPCLCYIELSPCLKSHAGMFWAPRGRIPCVRSRYLIMHDFFEKKDRRTRQSDTKRRRKEITTL